MYTVSLKHLPVERDVIHPIRVMSYLQLIPEPAMIIKFKKDNSVFTVSIPKNKSWREAFILDGYQLNVKFIDYGKNNGYTKMVLLT